ncbi:MAG: hypothetical protein AAGH46_08080 [Bacteroidota bacterium]
MDYQKQLLTSIAQKAYQHATKEQIWLNHYDSSYTSTISVFGLTVDEVELIRDLDLMYLSPEFETDGLYMMDSLVTFSTPGWIPFGKQTIYGISLKDRIPDDAEVYQVVPKEEWVRSDMFVYRTLVVW